MTFTRQQIETINVGTKIAFGLGDGRFGQFSPVVEITCRREDINGKLFVHGYREFGHNARMSFSIKEGSDTDARLYRIEE